MGVAMWELIVAILAIAALFCGVFFNGARRESAEASPGKRRTVLLVEVLGYAGAVAFLAGGIALILQRGNDVSDGEHVLVYAPAAALFFLGGYLVRRSCKTAVDQHLVDVLWFFSVAAFAGAVAYATHWFINSSGYVPRGAVTVLAVGVTVPLYSACLWWVNRRALQNFALFAGLVVTICGVIVNVPGPDPSLVYALALWGFGLAWAGLGWPRYVKPRSRWCVEPTSVTLACGAILALIAPSFAIEEHGSLYAIAILTAAAAMAASILLQNTPLLALGTLAAFGYVTWLVVRYAHEPLGIPATIAITGVLIIALAAVSARLIRSEK